MKNTLTVARREFAAYFNSPIAYIVIVVFLAISTYLFFAQLFLSAESDVRPFFGLAPLLFCFFAPAITMGTFAQEKDRGTLELLYTFPLSDWQVLGGKYLGVLGFGAVMVLLTTPFAFFVAAYGPLDKGPAIGGYLGLFLMLAGYMAIGVMASTWTKNQVIAYILGVVLCFSLFLAGKVIQLVPQWAAPIVSALSSDAHFQSISRGVVDLRDLVYYGSLAGVSLVVAQSSLESRRWR